MTNDVILDVFQRVIFPGLTGGEPCQVELIPVDPSAPIGAVIHRVKGSCGFRILCQDNLTPEGLLRTLLHEAGHAVLEPWLEAPIDETRWQLGRQVMLGASDWVARTQANNTRQYRETRVGQARERRIERWTDAQFERWITVFKAADAAIDKLQ
jgi:hypothetical protein